MTHEQLIKTIAEQASARGIAPATLCRLAVGNNRLYRNLTSGKSCTLEVAARFMKYIEANPAGEKVSP